VIGPEGWDRRQFLRAGAAASGGLTLSFLLHDPRRLLASDDPFAPNAFLRIDRDGTVTLSVPRPEMGQGVRTSLAMILAEELDADWSTIRLEQADLDEKYGEQYVGGSNSIPHSWEPLRRAGAAARQMLLHAAAERWDVDVTTCQTRQGVVEHGPSGRRSTYGELVARARQLPIPEDVTLKPPEAFRIVGKPTRGVDNTGVVTGAIAFGLDTTVPGMLYAVIERSPVLGGRPRRVGAEGARSVPGVHDIVVLDADGLPDFGANSPSPPNGIAVVADSTWAAMEGRRALEIDWEGGHVDESTDALRERSIEAARSAPARIARDDGDVEAALSGAAKTVEAVYELPLLAHASMEPMNCIARVDDDHCEIWVPTQNPEGARDVAQWITGLPTSRIQIHPLRMGGGFGRRFYADFVAEAVVVSQKMRRPVQVVWTREDDVRHGFFRPCSYHVMRGGIDADGKPIAWIQYLINASRYEFLKESPPPGADLGRYDFPAGFLPHLRLQASAVHTPIPRGQWRGVQESTNVFVYQSFIDELAHLAGRDPLDVRLDLLGEPREMPYDDDASYTYDTGRLSHVLRLAATQAGWGGPLPERWGRGIAASFANEAYAAHVVEVSVEPNGALHVHRVVTAIDCGIAVNPLGVQAQVEGSIIFGLAAMLGQEITVQNGSVVQGNFDDFPLVRIDEAPEMEVHIVPSQDPPLGMGEPALPPVAPAVANAIYAATGKRIRRLPLRREDLA
jgi:isoquinoline 1-oxidoreductase beta subunit